MNQKPEQRVERTSGLWRTVRNNGISTEVWELLGHSTMRIVFGNDLDVAYCPPVDGDDGNTNAAFIVRACNAHDRLVAACQAVAVAFKVEDDRLAELRFLPSDSSKSRELTNAQAAKVAAMRDIRAALALANVDPDDPATLERTADAVIESGVLVEGEQGPFCCVWCQAKVPGPGYACDECGHVVCEECDSSQCGPLGAFVCEECREGGAS